MSNRHHLTLPAIHLIFCKEFLALTRLGVFFDEEKPFSCVILEKFSPPRCSTYFITSLAFPTKALSSWQKDYYVKGWTMSYNLFGRLNEGLATNHLPFAVHSIVYKSMCWSPQQCSSSYIFCILNWMKTASLPRLYVSSSVQHNKYIKYNTT